MRSAKIQTPKVLTNWRMIAVGTSWTCSIARMKSQPSAGPTTRLPATATRKAGATSPIEKPWAATAPTARRKMSRALASFSRLSPSRIVRRRCGGRSGRSTAVAAAASGGATTAPRAIAAAQGIAGSIARTTTATATAVRQTANTTRLVTGAQLSRRSRGDVCVRGVQQHRGDEDREREFGGTVNDGAPGRNASSAPPTARNTGYGAPTRRAAAASATAARIRPMSSSSSLTGGAPSRAAPRSNAHHRSSARASDPCGPRTAAPRSASAGTCLPVPSAAADTPAWCWPPVRW